MPLISTEGAASAHGFGFGNGGNTANYIEDVFSTYLYTGNGSTQTISNGINLASKGGLTWIKSRSAATDHKLTDTVRGATKAIISDTTGAQTTDTNGLTSFGSNGFSIGTDSVYNTNTATYVSWTFRKQPKFFDVVTYTGTGSARTISHNLGSVPGCIIVKSASATTGWRVYHISTGNTIALQLDTAGTGLTGVNFWNNTTPTSTVFSLGSDVLGTGVNASGETYVAYIFASNAGGFGLTGTDNVISCGSFTTDGSGNATVNLGWEPQFVITKVTTTTGDWNTADSARGFVATADSNSLLRLNTSQAEVTAGSKVPGQPTATGFNYASGLSGSTFIYVAIRRGPMKVPTDATKVFSPVNANVPSGTKLTAGFAPDAILSTNWSTGGTDRNMGDRLRGVSTIPSDTTTGQSLSTNNTSAESTATAQWDYAWDNTGFLQGSATAAGNNIFWTFQRAPGFFDEVCYTGNSTAGRAITHNLGAVPELIIVKNRTSASTNWPVGLPVIGVNNNVFIDYNGGSVNYGATYFYNTNPTSSVFYVGNDFLVNSGSTQNYVAYLFASCPGVSKVGSYTGTGATQTINCGFTGGARFVLIKRTDSTGDWYVWDTARGMVSGTDPSLLLNSTAAEVNANSIYTATTGFQIVSTAAGINASGGSYIFFAVA